MTFDPARWERVKELYESASNLPASERERHVEEQCAGDAELRSEVLGLLAFHTPAENFLEEAPGVLNAPQRIGSYRILSVVGYGGMSAVYLGMRDDGQFEKRVAIKILRAGIFGEEVTRRFHIERQLLAEFDHPHIVRLLDGGVTPDGRPYLIQDYVDGFPLNEWMQQESPEPGKRLELIAELCEAVAYVHERGVVHRDLKPSNILVTKAGAVKLLDFGIAKLLDHAGPPVAGTLTEHLLGTPAYASPEQMLGSKVGAASDVYSLGLILYEMFANRPARVDSGWRSLGKESLDFALLPRAVGVLVKRCVERDPRARFGSGTELLKAIREMQASGVALVSRRKRPWMAIAATSVVIAGMVGYQWAPRQKPVTPSYQRIEGELPSFAPDQRRMALITIPQGGGRRRVTVRELRTGEEKHYSPAQAVKWSPDGKKLAFVRGVSETLHSVHVLELGTGEERELFRRPAVNAAFSSALAWTANSRGVICPFPEGSTKNHSLWAVDIATGKRTRLTAAPSGIYGDVDAAVSADGKRLAFVRAETAEVSDAYWKDLASGPNGPVYPLTADRRRLEGVEWMPGDGEVVFASRRNLAKSAIWKVAAGGQPVEPVLLQSEEGDCAYPAIVKPAGGGLRLAYWHRRREANLYVRAAPDYKVDVPVATGPLERYSASLSADGERVVFNSNETGNFELYVTDSRGSPPAELTAMRGPYTGSAQWSPDRQRIAFESSFGSNRDVFLIGASGGAPARFTTEPSNDGRPFWSRDGQWIYFRSNRSGVGQIWRKRSDGTGAAVQITRGGGVDPVESMDGRTLYYFKSQSDPGIWSVPVAGGEERMLLPGVLLEQWTVTSMGIMYLDRLVHAAHTPVKVYNPADGTSRALTSIPCANYCVVFTATPDARRLLWGAIERDQSDVRMVDLP